MLTSQSFPSPPYVHTPPYVHSQLTEPRASIHTQTEPCIHPHPSRTHTHILQHLSTCRPSTTLTPTEAKFPQNIPTHNQDPSPQQHQGSKPPKTWTTLAHSPSDHNSTPLTIAHTHTHTHTHTHKHTRLHPFSRRRFPTTPSSQREQGQRCVCRPGCLRCLQASLPKCPILLRPPHQNSKAHKTTPHTYCLVLPPLHIQAVRDKTTPHTCCLVLPPPHTP